MGGEFNQFGVDGGPAAKELIPKLGLAKKHISSRLHIDFPDIEIVYLLVSTPRLYDFYNYGPKEPQYSVLLNDFLQRRILLLLGDNKEATKEAENRLEFIKVVISEDSCFAGLTVTESNFRSSFEKHC
ncbi:hypothetical protein GQ457_01G002070 [Hibiscus cannabinus]